MQTLSKFAMVVIASFLEIGLNMWQSHSAQRIANKIRNFANDCFSGETPAGGDLWTLLATRADAVSTVRYF